MVQTKMRVGPLLRNGEVVNFPAGVAAGARGAEIAAGHVRLRAGAEEKGVFAGLEIGIEKDLIDAHADMIGLKGHFVIVPHADLASTRALT